METIRDLYNFYVSVYRKDRSDIVKRNYKYNMERYMLKYIGDKAIQDVSPTELLDSKQQKHLCKYLSANMNLTALCVMLSLYTGLRVGEICGLMWQDIDFEKETVHIRGTKTVLSDRVVPCPRIILTIAEKSLTGEITRSETGLKVSNECQRRIWKQFWTDCHKYLGGKIYRNKPVPPYPFGDDLTAYNLRHEYCTELARNGVDIRITQRLMGHSSYEMTLKVYTNLTDQDICTDEVRKIINKNTPFTG